MQVACRPSGVHSLVELDDWAYAIRRNFVPRRIAEAPPDMQFETVGGKGLTTVAIPPQPPVHVLTLLLKRRHSTGAMVQLPENWTPLSMNTSGA